MSVFLETSSRLVLQRVTVQRHPEPELGCTWGDGGLECVIESEGLRGKLRIQWKGTTARDVASLSRSLWESA